MRLIRQTTLYLQEGTSDKVYEVDLCEAGEDEYVVNFRYGKRNSRLREGTKTAFPEVLEKAEKVFERLVQSKVNKGYSETPPTGSTEDEAEVEPAPEESSTAGFGGTPVQRKKIAAHLSKAASGQRPPNWKLSRIIWRAGEMGGNEFASSIAKIKSVDPLDDYSIAWSLGKSGDAKAIPRLRELAESDDEKVRRIATEALLKCLPSSEAEKLAAEIRTTLPQKIREALENSETTASQLTQVVEDKLQNSQPPHDYLYGLYTQADYIPIAREAIHQILRTRPLKAPWFRAVRHIFKAAEFRLDAEIFGLLAWRFEKSDAAFSASWGGIYVPDKGKYVDVAEELSRPDTKFAYSKNTRNYLRRRVCRTMKRFGELNDPGSFITLATGVLMAYDDESDQKAVRSEMEYRWTQETGYAPVTKHFGPYAGYQPLNFLLHSHSSRYEFKSGKTWIAKDDFTPSDDVGESLPPKREEAFPQLWNHAPDALEHLLQNSKCGGVHEFAVKAWRDNSGFNNRVGVPFILDLLAKKYRVTQELGIDIAREKFDPAKPDGELILALLACNLAPARELAIGWLRECRDKFATDSHFIAEAILIHYDEVHVELRSWLSSARPTAEVIDLIVPKVVSGLLELDADTDEFADETSRNARETLLLIAGEKLGTVSHPVVRELLRHSLGENQILGAEFLALSQDSADEIPDELWELMLSSETVAVREIGMQLFSKLSDEALLERAEILASFCLSEKEDIRRAARPIVDRLAGQNGGFAQDLVLQFYPLTLRKETNAGLHDDVYELLAGPLRAHLHAIPPESCYRMMSSKYAAGQKLGFLILKDHVGLENAAMRQIVKLGDQNHLEGREYVWNYYREHLDRIREDKIEALRIVNSIWDDTREFAFDFFTTHFTEDDWNPELLVSICDSVRGDVQDFGRKLITRFFKNEDGQEYLLKLSQHPTSELQTFATNYLERYAGGNEERVRELELYFITVLSQVNRGRIAKQRVLRFLETEACQSSEIAKIVVPILKRISATIAIGDKAVCIRALRNISNQWPDLDSPLTKIEVPILAPE